MVSVCDPTGNKTALCLAIVLHPINKIRLQRKKFGEQWRESAEHSPILCTAKSASVFRQAKEAELPLRTHLPTTEKFYLLPRVPDLDCAFNVTEIDTSVWEWETCVQMNLYTTLSCLAPS